jgi:hypothetical protein
MSERWPAALSFSEACEYLGVKNTKGKAILDRIPSFQHDVGDARATARGDRMWRRTTLDLYIEQRERAVVSSPKAA